MDEKQPPIAIPIKNWDQVFNDWVKASDQWAKQKGQELTDTVRLPVDMEETKLAPVISIFTRKRIE